MSAFLFISVYFSKLDITRFLQIGKLAQHFIVVVDKLPGVHFIRIPGSMGIFCKCYMKAMLARAPRRRIDTILGLIAGEDKVLNALIFQFLQQLCFME